MIGEDLDGAVCSRAGCPAQAQWVIAWRNPRIHPADRRKQWAACDDHIDYLRGFLAARDFPLEVRTLGVQEEIA